MAQALSEATRGVVPIVPTPFNDDGSVALDDVTRLVDYYEACGVAGLTILGVMGEANKLSWTETLAVVDRFLAVADGRLPVLVGASGSSLAATVELSRHVMDGGGAGVMLHPPPGLAEGSAVVDYYAAFAERTGGAVPICVQDYPQSSGVHISVETWTRLSRNEAVFMLKHEPPAGLQKLSDIRAAEAAGRARRVAILTSNNAMHLTQELARGADGAMVGVAYTDLIVRICALHDAGQTTEALDLYDVLLPLIRHETQAAFGLAVRKTILKRRGALSSSRVRYPGSVLREEDLRELEMMIGRLSGQLARLGVEVAIRV